MNLYTNMTIKKVHSYLEFSLSSVYIKMIIIIILQAVMLEIFEVLLPLLTDDLRLYGDRILENTYLSNPVSDKTT